MSWSVRAGFVVLLIALAAIAGCGGDAGLVVKVSDEDGNPVSGVAIHQIGVTEPLGVTGGDGTATIAPQRGNGAVSLKLAMADGTEGPAAAYEFVNPYPVDEGHFNSRRRIIRVRKRDPRDDGTPATWVITSEPDSAEVLLGGRGVGTTPLELKDLQTGPVEMVVRKDGYVPHTFSFLLRSGPNEPVHIPLQVEGAPGAAESATAGAGESNPAGDARPGAGVGEEAPGGGASTNAGGIEDGSQDPGSAGTPPGALDTDPRGAAATRVTELKGRLRRAVELRDWVGAEAALTGLRSAAPDDPEIGLWVRAIEDGRRSDQVRIRASMLRSSITQKMQDGDLAGAGRKIDELLTILPGDALALQWRRELAALAKEAEEPPEAAPPTDEVLLQDLLLRYEAALEGLDVDAYASLWQELDSDTHDRIRKAFTDLKAQAVEILSPQFAVKEDRAIVSFDEKRVFVPRAGSNQEIDRRVVMTAVRGADNTWLILKLETQ